MEKKILIVTCFVMIAAGFFINRYQEKSKKEKYAALAEQEKEERKALEAALDTVMAFNAVLEKELKDYISDLGEHPLIKNAIPGEKNFRRLYYIGFSNKDGGRLWMNTGYGYNENEVKGFIRMDGNIIIYQGNPDNIAQNLIDESKLLTAIEQLAFYKDQYTISAATVTRDYSVVDKDNLLLKSKYPSN